MRWAFAHQGSFSHINALLGEALDQRIEGGERVDVLPALGRPAAWLRTSVEIVLRAPSLIPAPRELYGNRIATATAFDAMSRAAREHAESVDAAFVFQTQTLFDAHLPGRPFFVYTDFTHHAQLREDPASAFLRAPAILGRETAAYRAADRVFAASSVAATSLVEDYGLDPGRVVLLQTGMNVEVPDEVPDRSGRDGVEVLFVGVAWERKGGPLVLEAFRRLRAVAPEARLTIVGCPPDVGGEPGVEVVGRVPRERLPELFARADIFALPAHLEPAGIAYAEAAAWGLPVVATTAGGIPDRVVDGRTGFLVPPGDAGAVAEALVRLGTDPALRREMGAAGRAHAVPAFTWPHIADRMADEIGEVVGARRQSVPASAA